MFINVVFVLGTFMLTATHTIMYQSLPQYFRNFLLSFCMYFTLQNYIPNLAYNFQYISYLMCNKPNIDAILGTQCIAPIYLHLYIHVYEIANVFYFLINKLFKVRIDCNTSWRTRGTRVHQQRHTCMPSGENNQNEISKLVSNKSVRKLDNWLDDPFWQQTLTICPTLK